ncbi:hypothetical protein [Fervidibacter sacchari]|uniref:Uncharacterized protein n=1 Tax=Candidatus Fervidibacter sacchari TaxID=1448929 RepID=A0ABT2EKY5_9BACT|nr:hypothetical protein [Candidatus Fervidibacter sacchari]MCS3918601.1 hypothetical protein [Candidatus Fervidibacter sacchari]WKU17642.1 hypothetical protein Q2T83_07425 [Candidatus Fervidibacter sacchari]
MVCHQVLCSCHWLQPVVDDGIFERRIHSATIRRARLFPCRNFAKAYSMVCFVESEAIRESRGLSKEIWEGEASAEPKRQ